jgi:hypothetical protein
MKPQIQLTRNLTLIAITIVIFVSWNSFAQPNVNPLLDVVISPKPPEDEIDDLAGTQNPIDFFDNYSWRIFVALNWPALDGNRGLADTAKSIDDRSKPRVWESWKSIEETFLADGAAPTTWQTPPSISLCKNASTLGTFPKKVLSDLNQGDDNGGAIAPLIAQNRSYVRYEVRLNLAEYDSILNRKLFLRANLNSLSSSLPNGVINVKAAWRELRNGESADRYYKVDALAMDPLTGRCDKRQFVLIGFHIGQKTPTRPQWIWSTFEHVDNVSVDISAPPGTKASLNDPNKPQIMGLQPDAIDANHPLKNDPDPVQVVLESAQNRIPPQTAATNAKWHADPQIGNSFMKFYQLVRTQWPTAVPPNPAGAGSPFPSKQVANMTMETYAQSSSCIGCHAKTTAQTDFVWAISNRAFPIKQNLVSNGKIFNDHAKK